MSIAFLCTLLLVSCDNDDDNQQNQDPILGKWMLVGATFNGVDDIVNDCRARTSIEFFTNNTFVSIQYELDVTETECIIEEEVNATWQNTGNGTYANTTNDSPVPIMVSFSNDNNTLTITGESVVGGMPIIGTLTYNKVMN
ncbi:hypothetical protein D1816_20115 [Aquimarina sp. AD10]|nr:hypothetical protein D1816_20115 [Aquimarina sp. AD10]